jgi:hypothetical protein
MPLLTRTTQKTPCGPRRKQAHTGDNEPLPGRARRHLATSPFRPPDPEPPAECFAVGDKVTHDKYGLGTVTSVEAGIALLIDFGSHVQRILTPSAKLSKL